MSSQPTIFRVHQLAKELNIQSKYLVQVLNLVEPNKNHSPSTRLEIGDTNRVFYTTVCDFAVRYAICEKALLVLSKN